MSGWWFQPLWKILVSWDNYSQYMGKQKNGPNHQPVYDSIYEHVKVLPPLLFGKISMCCHVKSPSRTSSGVRNHRKTSKINPNKLKHLPQTSSLKETSPQSDNGVYPKISIEIGRAMITVIQLWLVTLSSQQNHMVNHDISIMSIPFISNLGRFLILQTNIIHHINPNMIN